MNSKSNFLRFVATAAFALAAFLFFALLYSYHIYNQEINQLFEFDGRYLIATIAHIGGFADCLSRFLTQFFYFYWAGAFIYALILAALQMAVFRAFTIRNGFSFVASFFPSAIIWIFLLSTEAVLSGPLAILISLVTASSVARISRDAVRLSVSCILIPSLYFLLGPASIVFAIMMAIREKRVLHAGLYVLCPFVGYFVGNMPLDRLFYGLEYYKMHTMCPIFLWIAVAVIVIFILTDTFFGWPGKRGWAFSGAVTSILLAVLAVYHFSSFSRERSLKYEILTINNAWNRIITDAARKAPSNTIEMACLNLALTKTGHIGSHLFDFPQSGPECLVPESQASFLYGLAVSEIYWQIGMTNPANRLAFEAQACIPDFQKSAWCYRRLARTNIASGKYSVAFKYLTPLLHTLFHKKWAEEQIALMRNHSLIHDHPDYKANVRTRYRDRDYLFSYEMMTGMLEMNYYEDVDNRTALDYLLVWSLLSRDLRTFITYCPFEGYTKVPSIYQEAYLMWEEDTNPELKELPEYISSEIVEKYRNGRTPYYKYFTAK